MTAPRTGFDIRRVLHLVLVFAFLATLLFSRTWRLGDKPLHHDESLFGYYAWFFAKHNFYEYDPILHGPLLIILSGYLFRLIGDNDATLRLVSVLCGLGLFALLPLLRRWLGRRGLWMALLLLLVSPTLCYYTRYDREEALFLLVTLTNLAAIAWTLESDKAWPLVLWPVSLALLIAIKENVVFIMASQAGFALLWIALDDARIAGAARKDACLVEEPVAQPQPGDRAVFALKLINLSLLPWCGVAFLYAAYLRPHVPLGWWASPLWLTGVACTALLLRIILRALRENPERIGLLFRLHQRAYCDRYWCVSGLALALAVLCVSFSICLTQPQPILTLLKRAVTYWWGEHASERLGNRFHCYAPLIALYELPALGIIAAVLIRDWLRHFRQRRIELGLWLIVGALVWLSSFYRVPHSAADGFDALSAPQPRTLYFIATQYLREHWGYLHLRSLGELFWAASAAWWGMIWTVRSIRRQALVRAWLIFWLFTSYLFYGYAGEKVPWLALHILLPLWLLAAAVWNEWCMGARPARRRWVAALLAALLAWNAWQTWRLCFMQPTNPAELVVYNHTCYAAKKAAAQILQWIESGEIASPASVAVSGEASWPLIWYLRHHPEIRFEQEAYRPSPLDEVVVADPGTEARAPVLRQDFSPAPFDLRVAWIPPVLDAGELLGLRALAGEPRDLAGRVRYRWLHSRSILTLVGKYILLRCPYSQLPSLAADAMAEVPSSGPWTATIRLADSLTSKPVPQAVITITTAAMVRIVARQVADLEGRAVFHLDAGIYSAMISNAGRHQWPWPLTLTVTGHTSETVVGKPQRDEPLGPVRSILWKRVRRSPDPLLSPREPTLDAGK